MLTILVVVLILMAIGALPSWNHSASWGPYPSSAIGLIVVVLVIWLLVGGGGFGYYGHGCNFSNFR